MIYIIKKDDIVADIKKIAKARDFVIFNGTKSPDVRNIRTGDETFMGLIPDNSILEKKIDEDLWKEKVKKFFKKPQITEIFAAIATVAINGADIDYHDRNQLVVLKNKAYTVLGEKMKKQMLKRFKISEEDNDVVFLYSDVEGMKNFIINNKDKYPEAFKYMDEVLSNPEASNKEKAKAIRYAHMAFTDPSKKTKKRLENFLSEERHHIEAILNS